MSGIELTKEILVLPEGMELDDYDLFQFALSVCWRGPRTEEGRGGYAVLAHSRELSRAGNWGFPQPFQQHQYRWDTLEEALEMARKHVNTRKINGHSWVEWQEKFAQRSNA